MTAIPVVAGVDIGLRGCGVALSTVERTPVLHRAWLSKNPEKKDDGSRAWLCMAQQVVSDIAEVLEAGAEDGVRLVLAAAFVERQQIRVKPVKEDGRFRWECITPNPSQILTLAYVTGAMLQALRAPLKRELEPGEWQAVYVERKRAEDRSRRERGVEKRSDHADFVWADMTTQEKLRAVGAELKTTGHNVLDSVGISKYGAARVRDGNS